MSETLPISVNPNLFILDFGQTKFVTVTQIHSPNIIKHLNMKKFPASQGHILLFYKTQ